MTNEKTGNSSEKNKTRLLLIISVLGIIGFTVHVSITLLTIMGRKIAKAPRIF